MRWATPWPRTSSSGGSSSAGPTSTPALSARGAVPDHREGRARQIPGRLSRSRSRPSARSSSSEEEHARPPHIPLWLKWGGSPGRLRRSPAAQSPLGSLCGTGSGARSPSLPEDLLLDFLPHWDLRVVFVWGFAAFLALAIAGEDWPSSAGALPTSSGSTPCSSSCGVYSSCSPPWASPPGPCPWRGYTLFDAVGAISPSSTTSSSRRTPPCPFWASSFMRTGLRALMLLFSFVLAAGVLVCRYHYSVDIAAAYFITYAVVKAHQGLVEPRWSRWTLAQRKAI